MDGWVLEKMIHLTEIGQWHWCHFFFNENNTDHDCIDLPQNPTIYVKPCMEREM